MKSLLSSLNSARPIDARLEQIIEAAIVRLQNGQSVEIDRLAAEHPSYAEQLRELLPPIEMMVRMGDATVDSGAKVSTNGRRDSLPHPQLGDFRLIRELGRGGMGTVFEAEQLSMGRHVALKVLPFAALVQDKSLQRFRNEVRAAAALDHPHIVAIYSVGEERGVHYYAMQLIRGQTLADLIHDLRRSRQAPSPCPYPEGEELRDGDTPTTDSATSLLPATKRDAQARMSAAADSRQTIEYFRTAARLGIQAAEALQHAHELGVLHRDIKPSNLMLDYHGKLYVTDFGLARIEADAGLTMTGDIVGTLRYMPPEQALAKRVVIDQRADVYSLGATLYELLTRQPAFSETDRSELLKQIAFEEPLPLRKLDRHIPVELEIIVLKAMAKDPEERYGAAQRFADDLQAFLENRPIKAKPPGIWDCAVKCSRRHRAAVWACGLTLLISAIAIAASAGWSIRDRQTRRALVDDRVLLALEDAQAAYQLDQLGDVKAALRQAESLLATSDSGPEIQRQVRQWESDLNMVQQLDEVRLDAARLTGGEFYLAGPPGDYDNAFKSYGIDVDRLDPQQAVKRISQSRIRSTLIAALDHWAVGSTKVTQQKLLNLSRAVDVDPWRNRLRDAIDRDDHAALTELAEEDALLDQAPATIVTLTDHLTLSEQDELTPIVLKRALRTHPTDFWINLTLGDHIIWRGSAMAAVYYRTALNNRTDSALAQCRLAFALARSGAYADAEFEYRRTIRQHPHYEAAIVGLAELFRAQERFTEAEDLSRDAIHKFPTAVAAYYNLGESLAAQGKMEAAVALYREFIRRHPQERLIYPALALVLYKVGQPIDAKAVLDELIRIDPTRATSYSQAGELFALYDDPAAAESACRRAVQLDPKNPFANETLVWVLQRLAKRKESELVMQEFAANDPRFSGNTTYLGEFLGDKKVKDGRFDQAIEWYKVALEASPTEAEIAMRAAILLLLNGNRESFEAICRQMLEKFGATNDPLTAYQTCWACAMSSKSVGDIDQLVRLAEIGLTDPRARWKQYRERGLIAYRDGDLNGALKWCAESRKTPRLPKEFNTSINLIIEAMALYDLGKTGEAKKSYDQAIDLMPGYFPNDGHICLPYGDWVDWAAYRLLRREAEALIEPK